MKPLNLYKALNGEPVMLRDKTKAFIKFRLSNENTGVPSLCGYYIDKDGIERPYNWYSDGKGCIKQIDDDDIIGMWEEPRPQVTITIPAPLKDIPKLNSYYWCIANDIGSFSPTQIQWDNSESDINLFYAGRIFASEEDCKAFIEAVKGARR